MLEKLARAIRTGFFLPDLSLAAGTLRHMLRSLLLLSAAFFTYQAADRLWEADLLHFGLSGVSLATSGVNLACWRWLRRENGNGMMQLETVALISNALVFLNCVLYLLHDFSEDKMAYLFLMLAVFAVSSITMRHTILAIFCTEAAIGYFLARIEPGAAKEYPNILLASLTTAAAIHILFRSVMIHQIRALKKLKATATEATRAALTDPLTGCANRRAIFDKMETLAAGGRAFWLGIFDIDNFKSVNDAYGHVVGDRLLSAIAARLETKTATGVTFGRIGGDEFAVIIDAPMDCGQAMTFAQSTIEEISRPFDVLDMKLQVGATAGFAEFPKMAATADVLYENADCALYKAKAKARGRARIFDTQEATEQRDNIVLERTLREADLNAELYLAFQPQMHLCDGTVRGFEALARWRSPVLGNVPPDRFIRAAERSGQIKTITECLLRKGIATLSAWPEEVGLSFNLSAQDVADRDFMLKVLAFVREAGVDPCRVEFEITETAIMTEIETASRVLTELSDAGCRIALDDFGAGYSSFQYLRRLPLNKVKIDKSFVREVGEIPASREIVAATVALCGRLGFECVLEGVETTDELEILTPLRPDIIQGYLFGRPMDADAAAAFISGANRHAHASRG